MEDKIIFNKKVTDKMKVSGAWSDCQDDLSIRSKVKFGDLKIANGQAKLGIFEMPSDISFEKCQDLYGHTLGNEYIHLFNIWKMKSSDNGIIDFSDNELFTKKFFYTDFFSVSKDKNIDSSNFNTILLDMSGLNNWLPSSYKAHLIKNPKLFGIFYPSGVENDQEIGTFIFKNKCFRVFVHSNVSRQSDGIKDYKFVNKSVLKIQCLEGITQEEAAEISCSMERLFILILKLKLNIEHIYLKDSDKNTLSIFPLYDHKFFKLNYDVNNLPILQNSISYQAVKEELPEIFMSWFGKTQEFKNLVGSFNRSVMFEYDFQTELLLLSEGIEHFFTEYDMSLRKEFMAMIYNLPTEYIYHINFKLKQFGGLEKWIRKIVATRVNYTHGTKRKNIMYNTGDVLISLDILKILIRIFALKQLGYLMPIDMVDIELGQALGNQVVSEHHI